MMRWVRRLVSRPARGTFVHSARSRPRYPRNFPGETCRVPLNLPQLTFVRLRRLPRGIGHPGWAGARGSRAPRAARGCSRGARTRSRVTSDAIWSLIGPIAHPPGPRERPDHRRAHAREHAGGTCRCSVVSQVVGDRQAAPAQRRERVTRRARGSRERSGGVEREQRRDEHLATGSTHSTRPPQQADAERGRDPRPRSAPPISIWGSTRGRAEVGGEQHVAEGGERPSSMPAARAEVSHPSRRSARGGLLDGHVGGHRDHGEERVADARVAASTPRPARPERPRTPRAPARRSARRPRSAREALACGGARC